MIQFLLGGDDTKQVDDKGQQDYSDEDEHHGGEVVGLASLVLQCLAGSLQKSMNKNHHLCVEIEISRPNWSG